MFDVIRTLDPANGLARGWRMRPPGLPDRPMWSVAVDIGGLAARGAHDDDYPMHAVGAYGMGRADTITRAAGEAVERYALFPREDDAAVVATARDLGPAGLDFAGSGLGDPAAADEPLRWYEGRWLDSGEPVLVPSGLVDYPVDDPWFDPTPSGAASGPDVAFAVRAGLLEIVERDAVGVAWAADAGLREFDLDLLTPTPSADWQHLVRLHRFARARGLRPRLVQVPVLPGLHCVLAAVVDGDLAAAGAKAHPDLGRALLVALQEALQVREALAALRERWGRVEAPEVVRDDVDRARLWLTPTAVAELERRLRDLPPARPETRPLGDLVAAVVADGGRPAVVDLTARLPQAHRSIGWHAVKVVVPGYQPLRMDERVPFGRCHDRIHRAGSAPASDFPHPLI